MQPGISARASQSLTACYEEIEQVPTCDLQLSDRILHPLARAEFPTVKLKITAILGRWVWKESRLTVL
ncbi:hypothetical protein ACCAA_200057 [Candidatus Accumulibacter aalborgensis]|uniref:Uncharacterized protein n=1 Tax=Candidatus Accumulibacter aalborgensis TaxID=1860102 RepID=A0A1A8XKT0_9PROT|nr:hypothetical protein ACCAA_200057 [Candidatus Accumulibacter aalborgensis]